MLYIYLAEDRHSILSFTVPPKRTPPTMKTKLTLTAAICCGLSGIGSAFTLDFLGDEGTTLPANPLVVDIPFYGQVSFEAIGSSELIVDNAFENDGPGQTTSPSLSFDKGESTKVTFLAAQPIDVTFAFVGVSTGEFFTTAQGSTANEFILTLGGTAFNPGEAGAGLFQIGFNQVPEPSTSLLGLIGGMLLVFRRRR